MELIKQINIIDDEVEQYLDGHGEKNGTPEYKAYANAINAADLAYESGNFSQDHVETVRTAAAALMS